ncbi:MAG TPA: hypothetical protein PLW81_11060 [Thiobacillaceae bacterium]|nr:hypothetical protein [Thiobacillaceae bacterium]
MSSGRKSATVGLVMFLGLFPWCLHATEGNAPTPRGVWAATLVPVAVQGVSGIVDRMFKKLGDWLFGDASAPAAPVSSPAPDPAPATSVQFPPVADLPPSPAMVSEPPVASTPSPAGMSAVGDALAVKLIEIDAAGTPIGLILENQARLKTGDRFVVEFATNLPGLVAVSNINPKGTVTPLDRYYAVGGIINRLPHAFRMQGTLGRETFRLEFVPCQDPRRKGQRHATGVDAYYGLTRAEYVEVLPTCDSQGEVPMSRDIGKVELIHGTQVMVTPYAGGTPRMISHEIFIEHVAQ